MDPDTLAALLQQNQIMGAQQSPLLALMAHSGVVPTAMRPGAGVGGSSGMAPSSRPSGGFSMGGQTQNMGRYGVPDPLWKAQVQQESGGRQFGPGGQPLRSNKGALGPAQVMPNTAREAAQAGGIPWNPQKYQSGDPAYSQQLGRSRMGQMEHKFGGRTDQALAGYNAGPNATQHALNKFGPQGYLQHLPKQTQAYVHKIMRNAQGGGGQAQAAPSGGGGGSGGSSGGGGKSAGGD